MSNLSDSLSRAGFPADDDPWRAWIAAVISSQLPETVKDSENSMAKSDMAPIVAPPKRPCPDGCV